MVDTDRNMKKRETLVKIKPNTGEPDKHGILTVSFLNVTPPCQFSFGNESKILDAGESSDRATRFISGFIVFSQFAGDCVPFDRVKHIGEAVYVPVRRFSGGYQNDRPLRKCMQFQEVSENLNLIFLNCADRILKDVSVPSLSLDGTSSESYN